MKTTLAVILSTTTILAFLCSYFLELTMDNVEQYLAITALVFMDGFFGIMAGIKREGFKTYKAIKVLKTVFSWAIILTVLLMIEKAFTGTGWLSETVVIPFIVFQLISALKNASMAGLMNQKELNSILDRIDKHKGDRK
jgi:phage-related holin